MVVVLIGVTAFFILNKESTHDDQAKHAHHDTQESQDHLGDTVDVDGPAAKKVSNAKESEVSKVSKVSKEKFIPQNKEEQSLHQAHETIAKVFANKENPEVFINFLKENELAPEQSVNSNEYTGTMVMIRSGKGLPGTRYFHAQYMGDDPQNTFLQHLSFQYKPGKDSLARAVNSAEASFDLKDKKSYRNGEFITYNIGEEGTHQLSIEKAKLENLKNDPYNAYTKEDEGVIITRIELKIHDDQDSEGHSHVE